MTTTDQDPAQNNGYDPTARSCGYCYVALMDTSDNDNSNTTDDTANVTKCPSCPRLYCSVSCRQKDQPTHHFWCGHAGEKGLDFRVTPLPGRGLGMVTCRPFARGEAILVERPVLTTVNLSQVLMEQQQHNNDETNVTTQESEAETDNEITDQANYNMGVATMALAPVGGTLEDKISENGVNFGILPNTTTSKNASPAAGLFVTFSRINHDCVGNSDHYFDHQHGVQVLVANTDIPTHTEITFPYTRNGADRLDDLKWRGFDCTCAACHDSEINAQLEDCVTLNDRVAQLGRQFEDAPRAQAVMHGNQLLKLYDQLEASDRDYARTHYDLFQILVTQQKSLHDANHHMDKAYQHARRFCGYDQHETVQLYKRYCHHPEQHDNYRVLD